MADTTTAPDPTERPLPTAGRLLALLAEEEPHDPSRAGGTVADILDHELAPGLHEWVCALGYMASKVRRHDHGSSEMTVRLDDLAVHLSQASATAEACAAIVRGQARPYPWRPQGTYEELSPTEHDDGPEPAAAQAQVADDDIARDASGASPEPEVSPGVPPSENVAPPQTDQSGDEAQ